jgi:hypothetical protein
MIFRQSFLAVLILAGTLFAQTFSFETRPYPNTIYGKAQWRVDLNGDGREDVISLNTNGGPAAFNVMLSNGDGSYGPPQTYQTDPNVGNVFMTFGDFNRDGKIDVITTSNKNEFEEWRNNGDGTLHLQAHFGTSEPVLDVAAADWNHDGKVDLAYTAASATSGAIHVLFGNGDGGFTVGPVSSSSFTNGHLHIGDVDGDGKADLIAVNGTDVTVWYGDSTGHFSRMTHYRGSLSIEYVPFDVDGDGKTDMIGVPWVRGTNGAPSTFYPKLSVIYGNSARTLAAATDLALDQCADPDSLPTVADFDGDGRPDVALQTFPCGTTGPESVRAYPGQTGRTVGAGQMVYQPGGFFRALLVLKGNDDSKPDLVVTPDDTPARIDLLVNTNNTGAFPGCVPDTALGIKVCSPSGASATSPVSFSIGAAGQTEMRKIEVWIDGAKKLESLRNFSHYAFLEGALALANGTHNVTIYAAGWDNLLQRKDLTLTVGSGGGGGGTCANPSVSTAISICAPASGSTVTSPVHVSAVGGSAITFMEVWVDGNKPFQTSGNHVDTDLILATGSHTMTIYGRNSSGVVGKATETFSVGSGGGGTCAQPSSSTATAICSPVNGSTVSNPVIVQARGGSSVNFMEVWVDGTKRFQGSGNSVSISLSLSAGSHKLTVYGRNGSTVLSKAVSTFTVH